MTTSIPDYDLDWEIPLRPTVQRSNKQYKAASKVAAEQFRALTGIDYAKANLTESVKALESLRGTEHFEQAVRWLLGTASWRLGSTPMEVRAALPSWFWEELLTRASSNMRFEGLAYVSESSFEDAIERWADKPDGTPLASINHYRKQRKDAWAMLPEHTFLALYAPAA